MKTTLAILATTASIALSTTAFAADTAKIKSETKVEQDSKGNYEKTVEVESKNSAGTKTTTDLNAKVEVDSDGEVNKKVVKSTSTDPKGLFNKTTVKTEDEASYGGDKAETKHVKKVNGKVVEESASDTHTH